MKKAAEKEIALAKDKLAAAHYLLEGEFFRDAVSRGYYSMYHCAKALLALRDAYPRTHSGVVKEFGLKFIKEEDIEDFYGKSLRFAKEKREKSDYDFLLEVSREEAEAVIQDAQKFLERIKSAIEELELKTKDV